MKYKLLVLSIFLLAIFLRFYNFENRITFGSEQARSLYVSANYIRGGFSLLGQEYFRVNSAGHKLFTSAIFNYTLVPLILLFKHNPIPITYFFTLLNLFTALILFLITKEIFNKKVALFSLILFVFNNYMVYHSMFIWVLNYMPLIGLLSFYLVWKIYKKRQDFWDILFLGILSGLGFGFEYLYAIAIVIVLYFLIRYSKEKLINLIIFLIGGILGDFTQVLFDLRHDFYHFKTLWQYGLDTLNGVSDAGFIYYHFLHFWPLFAILGGYILFKIYQKNKLVSLLILTVYLFFNLNSNFINFKRPVGMPEGLMAKDILKASEIIASQRTDNFNVVTLYDFDTRGYVLRYPLEFIQNKNLLGDEKYPESDIVFALAKGNYDFDGEVPWELKVIRPYNIENLGNVGRGFSVYKLVRQ